MSHFYLTLPSNASMKIYPDNTVAKYTTQLATNIELDGEWEVALTEIQYSHNFHNIKGEWFRIFYNYQWRPKVYIKDGYYSTVESLMEEVEAEVMNEAREMEIDINFHFAMPRPGNMRSARDPGPYIRTSSLIAELFANEKTRIDSLTRRMFVYCDVVEHVPVGDIMAPLLRTVIVRGNHGDQIADSFVNPMYIPVQKKSFGSIEVNIMTDTGDPVPFVDGCSTVTLHFKRASSPYFMLK